MMFNATNRVNQPRVDLMEAAAFSARIDWRLAKEREREARNRASRLDKENVDPNRGRQTDSNSSDDSEDEHSGVGWAASPVEGHHTAREPDSDMKEDSGEEDSEEGCDAASPVQPNHATVAGLRQIPHSGCEGDGDTRTTRVPERSVAGVCSEEPTNEQESGEVDGGTDGNQPWDPRAAQHTGTGGDAAAPDEDEPLFEWTAADDNEAMLGFVGSLVALNEGETGVVLTQKGHLFRKWISHDEPGVRADFVAIKRCGDAACAAAAQRKIQKRRFEEEQLLQTGERDTKRRRMQLETAAASPELRTTGSSAKAALQTISIHTATTADIEGHVQSEVENTVHDDNDDEDTGDSEHGRVHSGA
ncbi:hypothetical protein AURDEDRAFT_164625 [Auricularia subglabra TFB-10046 SS5]|nr:hypothetical protein AURDEDRAFT_164625 [Auricularia subglabra TFB-10046 SS5]